MANEVEEKKQFTTSLSQWSNEITGLIARDYEACGVQFDDYSKKCALEAMTSIYTLVKNDEKVNMGNLDTSNLIKRKRGINYGKEWSSRTGKEKRRVSCK